MDASFPFACLACRRSFLRRSPLDRTDHVRKCPVCAGPAIRLSQNFSPPRVTDLQQWAMVEKIITAGLRFQSLWRFDKAKGVKVPVAYPQKPSEVNDFLQEFAPSPPKAPATSPDEDDDTDSDF